MPTQPTSLSSLPPPPKGQTGVTLNQLKGLPPPPTGQTGVTLNQLKGLPPPPTGQTGMTLDQVNAMQPQQSLSDSLWSKLAPAKGIGQKADTLLQAGANMTSWIPGAKVGSALGTEIGGALAGETPQQIASQINPGQVLADTANSMLTAGSMAIPSGKLAQQVFPKAGMLTGQVLEGAALGAAQGGLNAGANGEDIVKNAEIGGAIGGSIPLVFKGVSVVANWMGSLLKGSAGLATGAGTDTVNQILKTPDAALKGLNGDTLDTLIDDTKNIRNQISELKSASTEEYSKALESLPGGYQEAKLATGLKVNPADWGTVGGGEINPTGTFIADVDGEKVPLTMKGVKDNLTSLLENHGAKIVDGTPDFFETSLKNSEQGILSQVWNDIYKWTDTSPTGLDKLATKINAYIKPGDTSPQLNGILSDLSQGTRKYLGERIPGAKTMVDNYIQQQKFIDELQTYLGKVDNPDDAVGIKNTMAKIQTLFTKNKEMARSVLEKLPGGADILGQQAGREVTTQIPRSTATIQDILSGIVKTIIPPKTIGQIVAYTGMTIEKAQPIINALQKLMPAERVVLIQAMLSGNQSSENPQ